ncbi:MAG TPA: hypothetical protein VK509_12560, partial [Polyangiales bacterium]|nr:hypothetical protein [Polyangiales bacterium]
MRPVAGCIPRAALSLGLALLVHASSLSVAVHAQAVAAPPPSPADAGPPAAPELAIEPSPPSAKPERAKPDPSAEPFVILPVASPAQPASSLPSPPRAALDDEAAPAHDDREWYGWQTLSVDAASLAFMVGGGAGESGGVIVV